MRDYIGIPYIEYGRTREGVDCWGLVCLYYQDKYGIKLPSYDYGIDTESQAEAINQSICDWKECDDGDVILLRQFRLPSHVGIVEGDYFYHCEEGIGVHRVKLDDPRWSKRIIKRYKYYPRCYVTISPSPLMTRRFSYYIDPGRNLLGVVREYIEDKWLPFTHVTIQGQPIRPELWGDITLKPGAIVTVTVVPKGKGGSLLRTVLSIAVMAWAGGAGGGLMSRAFSVSRATGAAIAGAVGLLAVNAIVPPPRVDIGDLSGTGDSSVYSISGGQNRIAPYGSVPVVLGTYRFAPPYAAKPYTMIQGNDQYLCCLFAVGYGPLTLNEADMKIGDTALTSFSDYEIEIREGTAADADITLYPDSVSQTVLNVELTQAGGTETRTTETDTDECIIDITCPRGLVVYSKKGNPSNLTVKFTVQYRATGSTGAWTDAVGGYVSSLSVTTAGTSYKGGWWELDVSGGGGTGASARARVIAGRVSRVEILKYGEGYTSAPTFTMPAAASGSGASFTAGITAGIALKQKSTDPVRRGYRIAFPSRGQYDVAITRMTSDYSSSSYVDDTYWTAIRSVKNEDPISTSYNLAKVALRIKASGQLNGIIDNFTVLASSRVTSWDSGSSTWVTDTASRNPADIYRYLLQGPFNVKAIADDRIDLIQLATWAEFCDTKGFSYDAVLVDQRPLADRLMSVASIGRASFSMNNNKFSVTIEDMQTTPVQMFGPKNIKSFSAGRKFVEIPHAFRVKFFNRDNNYLQEERKVYADGYDETNSTLFQELSFFGATDKDHVWKLARFHLAQLSYRQETFHINVDYEHLVCTRGDLVLLRHDAPVLGISDGRVLSVSGTTITVDENCPMESGKSYSVSVRKSDGTIETLPLTLSVGDNTTLTASTGTFTCAQYDYFHFGETDSVDIECLVSIIEPGQDLEASLTLVPYDDSMYTADSGTIPSYSSQASFPDDLLFPTAPTELTANEYLYSESGLVLQGVTLLWLHGQDQAVDKYEVEIYRPDGPEQWQPAGMTTSPMLTIPNLPVGYYSFRVRTWNGVKVSEWLTLEDEYLDAQNEVPDDVENIRLVYRGGVPWITWGEVEDPRILSYEVRMVVGTLDWDSASPVIVTTALEYSPEMKGTYLVKAAYSNAYSANYASVYVPYNSLETINVKKTKTEQTTWDGDLSGDIFPAPPLYDLFDGWYRPYKYSYSREWDHKYDCDVAPTSDGWTEGGYMAPGSGYSTDGDILSITGDSSKYFYRSLTSDANAIIVEARVRVSGDEQNRIDIYHDYYNIFANITITESNVIVGDGVSGERFFYTVDFTNYRKLRIEVSREIFIYIDDELLLRSNGESYTGTGSSICFGKLDQGESLGTAYWDYVYYAQDLLTFASSPLLDGWSRTSTNITYYYLSSNDWAAQVSNVGAEYFYKTVTPPSANACMMVKCAYGDSTGEYHSLQLYDDVNKQSVWLHWDKQTGAYIVEDRTPWPYVTLDSGTLPLYPLVGNEHLTMTLILWNGQYYALQEGKLFSSGTAGGGYASAWSSRVGWGGNNNGVSGAKEYFYSDISYVVTDGLPNGLRVSFGDTGEYEIPDSDIVDLGHNAESLIDSHLAATLSGDNDLLEYEDLLTATDLLHGATGSTGLNEYVSPQIRLHDDSAWDDWTPLVPGSYYARKYDLKTVLTASDNWRTTMTAWQWEVDMPDRRVTSEETTSATGDTTVTFDPVFQTSDLNVQVTIYDKQAGDHAEITNVTTSGFTLNVYNSGSRVVRNVYCLTQGY